MSSQNWQFLVPSPLLLWILNIGLLFFLLFLVRLLFFVALFGLICGFFRSLLLNNIFWNFFQPSPFLIASILARDPSHSFVVVVGQTLVFCGLIWLDKCFFFRSLFWDIIFWNFLKTFFIFSTFSKTIWGHSKTCFQYILARSETFF